MPTALTGEGKVGGGLHHRNTAQFLSEISGENGVGLGI